MNKKSFRKLAGGGIIILWVVMIGLLVKKVHFDTQEEGENTGGQRAVILDSSEQEWMEIFLKDKKVGYSVRSVRPEGEDYLIWENLFLKLNLLGQANIIQTSTHSRVYPSRLDAQAGA